MGGVEMKRYFFVSYIASSKNNRGTITGSINIEATDCHISRSKVTEIISDKNGGLSLYDIVITSFQEMTESDYKDWCA